MVLRCAWGTCNVDERYPERLANGVRLVLFPKPKTNLEKCLRWIKACNRPHDQLNVQRINKHKAVCSKHFVGGNGPTPQFPDPVTADGTAQRPARLPRRQRVHTLTESSNSNIYHFVGGKGPTLQFPDPVTADRSAQGPICVHTPGESFTVLKKIEPSITDEEVDIESEFNSHISHNVAVQTEETWVSGMDMLAMATELHILREKEKQYKSTINQLKESLKRQTENQTSKDQDPAIDVDDFVRRGEMLVRLFRK
ncbi:uncharacterized protein LOC111118648 isoform X3 [Crassostrea virginica]